MIWWGLIGTIQGVKQENKIMDINDVPLEVRFKIESSLRLFLATTHNLRDERLQRQLKRKVSRLNFFSGNTNPYCQIKEPGKFDDPCQWFLAILLLEYESYSLSIEYETEAGTYCYYYGIVLTSEKEGLYALMNIRFDGNDGNCNVLFQAPLDGFKQAALPFVVR